jgi:ACS family glucarate transporter-like MFS transporter
MPARFRLVAMTFALSMLLYIDRVAISTAKVPLTLQLGLSDTEFGWALSAFALGYAVFQTPAGSLADRWGPRRVMTAVVGLWSVFTTLTGVTWSFLSLLTCRFLFGMGEAGAYPTCARAFYSWLPVRERGLAQGINFSGSRLGAAFALPVVAWFVSRVGWRAAFFLLGGLGVVCAVSWWMWFRDLPEEHRGVSAAEKALIIRERGVTEAGVAEPLPGRVLFGSVNLWLAMGQYFASNFTFFFCLTWLFPYLQRTYHLDPVATGLLSSGPLLAGAVGNWVGGWVVDSMYARGAWRRSRQVPAVMGFLLAAGGLMGSLVAQDVVAKVGCLAVAIFGADMTLPPSWAFCIDVGRRHAGAVAGTMNMAGNLGSFATGLAFPYLLAATGSPVPFFVLGAVLNLVAAGLWTRIQPDRTIAGGSPVTTASA